MNQLRLKLIICAFAVFIFNGTVSGFQATINHNSELNKQEKNEILTEIKTALKQNHLFPKVASELCAYLSSETALEDLKKIDDPHHFVTYINKTFLRIGKDLHLSIEYLAKNQSTINVHDPKARMEERLKRLRKENFGFKEIGILEGNVGYLKIDVFYDPQLCQKKLESSMRLLENTDAMILDLRNNRGGSMEMVQLICSYFWPNDPQEHLVNYFYLEKRIRMDRQMWTLPSVAGKRRPNVPLYVLTSNSSFSAAEWMALILKSRKRATVIGEKTAGGAHPVKAVDIGKKFRMNIPFGMVTDVKSKYDFESKGVVPDHPALYRKAKSVAHKMALDRLHQNGQVSTNEYQWIQSTLESEIDPVVFSNEQLEKFVGSFGNRKIWLESSSLFYSYRGAGRYRLTPIGGNIFLVEGLSHFRLQFNVKNGQTIGLFRIDRNGSRTETKRTSQ